MKKGRKKRNRSTPTHSDTNKKSKQPTDIVTADIHSDSENWTDINDVLTDQLKDLESSQKVSKVSSSVNISSTQGGRSAKMSSSSSAINMSSATYDKTVTTITAASALFTPIAHAIPMHTGGHVYTSTYTAAPDPSTPVQYILGPQTLDFSSPLSQQRAHLCLLCMCLYPCRYHIALRYLTMML